MAGGLRDLDLLVIDCQASGATPAHGDLLEIGWALCGSDMLRGPVQQHFVVPRTERRIPAAVRELTGWSEACVADAWDERAVWSALRADIARVQALDPGRALAPAVIHFARFELVFLRDLHARLGGASAFPLDTICLHAIATRLFPDLPRRNIRALAGYLGHSTDLLRRCGAHVEATAFIWRALVPRLEQAGVSTWSELAVWLQRPAPARKGTRRTYPFAVERRRALPDGPGVYRFLRSNGDVLYVGKATSIRKRVAGHFAAQRQTTERALELLTQVLDIEVTQTASILEAALLESDEIKRLDPPYNVQLRSGERQAWFASNDLSSTASALDHQHRVGPLPSRRALLGLHALIALANRAEPMTALQACALAVPSAFLPDAALFAAGWQAFTAAHLQREQAQARVRVEHASAALWLLRGRAEPETAAEPVAEPADEIADVVDETATDGWDLARVLRRLERTLIQSGLLIRRARWLGLLAHAEIAFRERTMSGARVLVLTGAQISERRELERIEDFVSLPARRMPERAARQACFDALAYDRMRVLATELNRVQADGGEVALRLGKHSFAGSRLAQLMRWV